MLSNLFLFSIYLLLTHYGLDYKISSSLLFALGTLQTFIFNRRWTFNFKEKRFTSFIRYFFAYFFCYWINILSLIIAVEYFEFPHQITQAILILVIAFILFLMQKYWVFRQSERY
jgi:putative flippase GtrA